MSEAEAKEPQSVQKPISTPAPVSANKAKRKCSEKQLEQLRNARERRKLRKKEGGSLVGSDESASQFTTKLSNRDDVEISRESAPRKRSKKSGRSVSWDAGDMIGSSKGAVAAAVVLAGLAGVAYLKKNSTFQSLSTGTGTAPPAGAQQSTINLQPSGNAPGS